jgi:hypothetical protein
MVWTVNDPAQMMEVGVVSLQTCVDRSAEAWFFFFFLKAVRWGVDAILTDVTRTWLKLRAALDGTCEKLLIHRGKAWDARKQGLTSELGDYEKVGAQYTRSFLWTGPLYYTAVQYGVMMKAKRKLEKVAGSFDMIESELNARTAMVRVRV